LHFTRDNAGKGIYAGLTAAKRYYRFSSFAVKTLQQSGKGLLSAFIRINAAAAFGATAGAGLPVRQGVDYGGGAADPGLDCNGTKGAVAAAGSAFHAGVAVADMDPAGVHHEDFMGAYFDAGAAPGALAFVQFEGRGIAQVKQVFHMSGHISMSPMK